MNPPRRRDAPHNHHPWTRVLEALRIAGEQDGLPSFDLAGYDAERYRLHAPDDAPDWNDLSDADRAEAVAAVGDGFTTAVQRTIAAQCRALLDTSA